MKIILILLTLCLGLNLVAQTKQIHQIQKEVKLYWNEEDNTVLITDSNNIALHPLMVVTNLEPSLYKDEQILLLYGDNVIITYGTTYIAYDSITEGFVYNLPSKSIKHE